MKRSTDKIELVETQNIALSINRMRSGIYDTERWKRALYHAALMTGCATREELTAIREALKLP